jgi:hypothetical protein
MTRQTWPFGKDIDRHQPHDDDSSTANLANREPGLTTVFAAATIVKRPLTGAMISCRASSIRISAIGSPAATIAPSAMNHRSTIPSGNILDAQSGRGADRRCRQIVRDWVLRFNAEGLGGLLNDKAPATPTIGKMSTFKS